jgi:hypothetical protein
MRTLTHRIYPMAIWMAPLLSAMYWGPASAATSATTDSGYSTIFNSTWSHGIPAELAVEKALPSDITVVDDPADFARKAVKVEISLDENYSHVANGAPRAEVVFPGALRFLTRTDYLIQWSTYIAPPFTPDLAESVVITQIHQGDCCSGPPPIMLTIRGDHYEFAERSRRNAVRQRKLSKISKDIGRWVNWTLRYVPDPTGGQAKTELSKNGVIVYMSDGWPNAYADNQTSYLKIGLYKSKWVPGVDGTRQIRLLFGNISILARRTSSMHESGSVDQDAEEVLQ